MKNHKKILILILLLSFLLRVQQITYPNTYVFDEVYYAFTAKRYVENDQNAWSWQTKAPENKAYAWVNPPLAQEIMAVFMVILNSKDPWVWRLPGILLGVTSIYLVYVIAKNLFKDENLALVSSFLYSLDGLNFVQSRTAMLDIYLTFFILATITAFIKKSYLITAILLGLAIAAKWTAIYIIPILISYLFFAHRFKPIFYLPPIALLSYLATYLPFFFYGYSLTNFYDLLNQQWWYHTNLKATHDYASPWWSWPLNLYPVWYFVEYQKGGVVSNIFASGTHLLYITGIAALILSIWDYLKGRASSLLLIVLLFLSLWLPWSLSPRIMFLYYFTPAVPFLCILLGLQFNKLIKEGKNLFFVGLMIGLIVLNFLALYPFLIGTPIPQDKIELFFRTNLTKNPFGG